MYSRSQRFPSAPSTTITTVEYEEVKRQKRPKHGNLPKELTPIDPDSLKVPCPPVSKQETKVIEVKEAPVSFLAKSPRICYFDEDSKRNCAPPPTKYSFHEEKGLFISFDSQTLRFKTQNFNVPGPGTYSDHESRTHHVQRLATPQRIQTAPSIPYKHQTLGYIERNGKLNLRKLKLKRYTQLQTHSDFISKNVGTIFSKQSKRSELFRVNVNPAPDCYDAVYCSKSAPRHSIQNTKCIRFGTFFELQAQKMNIPGPGMYETIEIQRPQSISKAKRDFLIRPDPFCLSVQHNIPGPGHYNVSSTEKRKSIQPFDSSDLRFKNQRQSAPAPNLYKLPQTMNKPVISFHHKQHKSVPQKKTEMAKINLIKKEYPKKITREKPKIEHLSNTPRFPLEKNLFPGPCDYKVFEKIKKYKFKPYVEHQKRTSVTPGPQDYDPKEQKIVVPLSSFLNQEQRLPWIRNHKPAPNTYNTELPLVKRTFNATLIKGFS